MKITEFGHSVPVYYTQAEWRKYCRQREYLERYPGMRDFHRIFDNHDFCIEGWDLL